MADFTNTEGAAFSAVNSKLALGADTIDVLKFKPGGSTREHEYGWVLGNATPACHIDGRVTPGEWTFTVAAKQWDAYTVAHPNWLQDEVDLFATLTSPKLGSLTYQGGRCKITAGEPNEHDSGATSQAVVDLKAMPLGFTGGANPWQ